nr:hypothetical protein CFP56_30589 [Quercus suber]
MTGKRSSLIKYPKDGVIHSKVMQRICVIIGDGLLASRGGINLATTIAGISLFCRSLISELHKFKNFWFFKCLLFCHFLCLLKL